jgi:hypothetical protein
LKTVKIKKKKINSTYKSGLFAVVDVEFMGDDET